MKNKTVLMAMSGGVKSLVAAYILKKQGMVVTGAYIQIPSLDGESFSLKSSCHETDDSKVKKYCDLLQIPYVKIDGSSYYQEFIVQRMLAARLTGETFIPCVYCNEIRTELLIKKADNMKIDYFSTGHLAQVSKNPGKESYSVSEGNDAAHDQSYFLSRLNNSQLERAILPLGKLKYLEIKKIAKNLLGKTPTIPEGKICFVDDKFLPKYIEENTPDTLRPRGPLIEYFDDLPLGEHDGIYKYHMGEDHIKSEYAQLDSNLKIVAMNPDEHVIKVAKNWKFEDSVFFLKNFNAYLDMDQSKPIECMASIKPYSLKLIPCTLFLHNNDQAHIELLKPLEEVVEKGTYVVLYNNFDNGRKIIGGGSIFKSSKEYKNEDLEFRL